MCYCTPSRWGPYCNNCARYMRTEIEHQRAEIERLTDVVSKINRTNDHLGMRVRDMKALIEKVGAGDTAAQGDMLLPANAKVTGSPALSASPSGLPG